jgi:membrane peptidoglycan carboxypeptidase
VVCGILAGVVVAAAAFPALGVTGLTAKAASDSFQSLPSELKTSPLPQTSYLYAADGSYITSFYDENREITSLKDVPQVMQHAMVAAEDVRFYEHKGVDMQGVVRAFVANQQAGEITQGASTLTQQYVKNILKYSAKTKAQRDAAEADTPARKLREMRYAVQLEKKYTKPEMLERYLNIAFFGNGGYGIGSASKVYFSKQAKSLTLAEAAMLAGMVKSPTQYNPLAGPKSKAKAQERRDYVLDRMVDQGFISQEQADVAKKQPIQLKPRKTPQTCVTGVAAYGFYCDWFLSWWKSQPEFGKNSREREDNLRKGGYKIYTALDPKMQAAAQRAVDGQLPRNSKFATGTVLIQPGTGRVQAMAINRSFSLAKNPTGQNAPNTVNPLLTGSSTSPGYQAGSTFKMFTMVAALSQGMPLNTTIEAPYRYKTNFRDGSEGNCNGFYCPHNASEGMTGVHTMWSGFGESVNTFFVQLEEQVGVKAAVEAAEKLGVVFRASGGKTYTNEGERFKAEGNLSFTLGTALVTPLDMATSYATIAARGKHCKPNPLARVLDRDGKEIKAPSAPKCAQVIPPDVADAAADAARCPVGDTAMARCAANNGVTARRVHAGVGRPIAGKTGTTNNTNAAWFAGFTPNLAGAVFLANPDAPNQSVNHISRIPVTVFINTMSVALQGLPVVKFTKPTKFRAYGIRVNVPDVDGFGVGSARSRLIRAGFKVRVSSERVPSRYQEGLVARTSPSGGSIASKGGVVVIYRSNGERPDPKPSVTPTPRPSGPIIIFPPFPTKPPKPPRTPNPG